jgi:hypothetical protein
MPSKHTIADFIEVSAKKKFLTIKKKEVPIKSNRGSVFLHRNKI